LVELDDPRVGRITQVGPIAVLSENPAVIDRPAPLPGQHTAEVLAAKAPARPAVQPSGGDPRRPLEGIVVLDLGTWLAGPFAGALMADLGARVIKIERLTGDPYRAMLNLEPPSSSTWATDNMMRTTQGKESLAINLKLVEAQEIIHRLVAKADVVMHNFRPGAPDRIGLSYDTLRKIKPDLVYVYAASYGSTGPHAQRAAFNPTIGALSGNSVFQSGEGNNPKGDQSPDPISGSGVATGIMLGLAARLRTGRGQYVETRMMNSVVYCNSDDALDYAGKPPRRIPDRLQLGLEATYRLYETKDGWVFLAAPMDQEFETFCAAIERRDLTADPRFDTEAGRYEHRATLGEALEPVFMTRTADEWEALLTSADVGCVRADGLGHRRFLHEDPHSRAIGFMVPTEHQLFASSAPGGRYWRHRPFASFSETPCEEGLPFADLGEHTKHILEELGYTAEEITELEASHAIYVPQAYE
jgi:crotonobetainyl-CoA:carnitine CoA-transferase CaiB-like acyl-CoA transferase